MTKRCRTATKLVAAKFVIGCMMLLALGCGGDEVVNDADPTVEFGGDIKIQALAVAETAKVAPLAILNDVTMLQASLSEVGEEEAGTHKATYDQIKSLAAEIQTMYESEKPSISAIKAKAEEIAKLAEQLPDDAELMPEGEG